MTGVTNVGWPNPAAPGLSAFRLDVPSEWSQIEPAGALVAFLAPAVGEFRVSLTVYGERTPGDIDLGKVAENALLAAGAKEIWAIGVDGADSDEKLESAARLADIHQDGSLVRHLVVTTEAPDRSKTGMRSVYALVGTCLTAQADIDEHTLTAMISSFTFTGS
jgi:hypothetical protein